MKEYTKAQIDAELTDTEEGKKGRQDGRWAD